MARIRRRVNKRDSRSVFGLVLTLIFMSVRRSVCRSVGRSVRRSVRPSVHLSVRLSHFTFSALMEVLALLLLPKCSADLNYGPCPPARDRGSRVSGLVLCILSGKISFFKLLDYQEEIRPVQPMIAAKFLFLSPI